jgi:hypothetical protein
VSSWLTRSDELSRKALSLEVLRKRAGSFGGLQLLDALWESS